MCIVMFIATVVLRTDSPMDVGATAPLSGQSNSTKAAATATPSTAYQQHGRKKIRF